MNTDHLPFPDEGWGYLPPTDEVFRAFQFARQLYKPKHVLEIGFHLGHSTTYQLEIFKNSTLVSVSPFIDRTGVHRGDFVDPTLRWKMAIVMYKKYKGRWVWIPGKSHIVRQEIDSYHDGKQPFDFALVDGGHTYEPASYDMQMCVDFGLKAFLLDNFELKPVRNAFNDNPRLKLRKRFFYEQTFKGKTRKNQLALIEILPEGVDIDTTI